MTIPSRPAPPPPTTSIAQNPTSLGRLQQNQFQNQNHLLQNQLFASNGGVEKLTIKLPPPPNCRTGGGSGGGGGGGSTISRSASTSSYNSNNNNNNVNNVNKRNCNNINICTSSSSGSITRKFPPANVRYSPATDWDGSPFEPKQNNEKFKKIPPPRPPPPKIIVSHLNGINGNGNGNRQKSRPNIPTAPPPQQQSVNILTNIFNRKKSTKITGSGGGIFQQKKSQKTSGRLTPNQFSFSSNTTNITAASNNINNVCNYNNSQSNTNYGSVSQFGLSHTQSNSMMKTSSLSSIIQSSSSFSSIGGGSGIGHEPQLISFDSPPSSPTFTQKSNSDCVSVDSFSSDSNFSSPNNGSASQPESGFEDDFTATRSTTSPLDPWETLDAFRDTNYCYENNMTTNAIGTAPVRNFSTINTRIQNSNDNLLCNGKSLLPPIQSLTMPTIIKPKISQKPRAPKPPATQATQFFGSDSMISKLNYFEEEQGNNDDDDNQPGTPPSPPMPKCPPPPPPPPSSSLAAASQSVSSFPTQTASSSTTEFSMLDVINGKIDILSLDSKHENSSGSHHIPENAEPYGIALYDFDGAVDGDLSFRENEKIYILEKLNEEWLRGRTRSGCEGIFPANYIEIKVPLSEFKKPFAKVQAQNFIKNPIQSPPKVRCLYMFNAEEPGDLPLQENDIVTVLYRINEDWLYGEIDGRNGQFPSNFLEYVPSNLPQMPSC